MVNKICLIILVCFCSCKKRIKVSNTFFPNISINVDDLKGYEKKLDGGGVSFAKKDKDTITSYGFCRYLKTNCSQSWEVFFNKKDSSKIFSLLEKKELVLSRSNKTWLTEIKYDTMYSLEKNGRSIKYICYFEDYGIDSSSIKLYHKLVLYDKEIDWDANYHPSFYNDDLFEELWERNVNEEKIRLDEEKKKTEDGK